jgi:hypothetical protein
MEIRTMQLFLAGTRRTLFGRGLRLAAIAGSLAMVTAFAQPALADPDVDPAQAVDTNNNGINDGTIADVDQTTNGDGFGDNGNPTIVDGSIAEDDLANDSVVGGKNGVIKDESITSDDIQNGSLTGADIANDSLTADDLGTGSVGSDEVTNDSLTADDLGTDSVTADELADKAVDTAAIQNDAVTTEKIATDAVTDNELADKAVDTAAIQNSAVTTNKIRDGAVTTAKIRDGAVTTAKIADDAVTFRKLAPEVRKRFDENTEGVAMAIAMGGTYLPQPGETFRISGNWGNFEGSNALAFSGALSVGGGTYITAGAGIGLEEDTFGGRAGVSIGW